MVIRKPHVAPRVVRLFNHYIKTPWCASLVMSVGLVLTVSNWQNAGEYASLSPSSGKALSISFIQSQPTENTSVKPLPIELRVQGSVLPNILTQKDIELYQQINTAQKTGNWRIADNAMKQISNPVLMGHVLAKRYLNPKYESSASELSEWLSKYSDHPQANEIYQLAVTKVPAMRAQLTSVTRSASLEGYGDDNGMGTIGADSPYTVTWHMGLDAWKKGNKEEAAKFFTSVASHQDKISPWMASAANYWSYRAHKELGHTAEADKYLQKAADHPRSFYGILACKQLHRPLDLQVNPVALTESDVLEMIGDPAIRRTIALTQAGMDELADKELRAHYPQIDNEEKPRLLALAHSLNLPSIEITLAARMRSEQQSLDFARYPIPDWQPEGGFTVDPALMYALIRQESGFRASAVSPGGALGLMQLMPQTASLMQKRIANTGLPTKTQNNVTEPVVNITLGQNYLHHLLDNKLVDGNLFYLLAAYNAGPGRLQEWKRQIDYNEDPLLFVESIPYAQTRNYVMQVMTNYWIYSELTGNANYSVHALLHDHWPSYEPYKGGPVAQRAAISPAG